MGEFSSVQLSLFTLLCTRIYCTTSSFIELNRTPASSCATESFDL